MRRSWPCSSADSGEDGDDDAHGGGALVAVANDSW